MKKELITVENLDTFLCVQDRKLYMGQNRMLTPGAKDELRRRGVEIVYGEEPVPTTQTTGACHGCCGAGRTFFVGPEAPLSSAGSLESLSKMVAAMLRREYGVTDPKELQTMTVQALKTIKNSL